VVETPRRIRDVNDVSDMKKTQGYAPVNGLKMYYEINGDGNPLVLIRRHLAVAGVNEFPALAQTHRVITFDLQGHGRTADPRC
jgi:pimeloyl-ACP methyl ester carboxylesterase